MASSQGRVKKHYDNKKGNQRNSKGKLAPKALKRLRKRNNEMREKLKN